MTAPRSYGQNCSLARAMDLLGERWTVLIVRELARGPKRFGELHDGLAGIGTTMLAARLKRLENAEVIARSERSTGSSSGYQLTARGEQLAHALGALMLWGLDLPELYQPQDQSRAAWLAMNMQAALERADAPPPAGTYAFQVGEERFWLHVAEDARSALRDGTPPYPADATLIITFDELYALAAGTRLDDLTAAIQGDRARFLRVLEVFQAPTVTVASPRL